MAVAGVRGLLVTPGNYDRCLAHVAKAPRLVVDVETTGVDWHRPEVYNIGYAILAPTKDRQQWRPMYFPFRHKVGNNLPRECQNKLVRALLGKKLTNWNLKFDLHMMQKDGLAVPRQAEDVMLAHHLLNENEFDYRLKRIASVYTYPDAADAEKRLKIKLAEMGLGKGSMGELAPDGEVADYACDDVVNVEDLRRIHVPALKEWKLYDIWQEVNEYMLATKRMESVGLVLDLPLVATLADEARRKMAPALKRVKKLAGYDINLNSSKQLQAFLGMPSTAREKLEERLEQDPDDPAIDALMTYRGWNKVLTSYYEAYQQRVANNGRLYPNIKLHGTISGRPSCENPNLQAVPRKDKKGIYRVKEVFVSPPGYTLVQADLSQAELRLFAHHSEEPVMMETLRDFNADIHQATADRMKVDRDNAKRINFGIVYGLGVPGLAKSAKISEQESQRYLDLYHGVYKSIKPFYRKMEATARHFGYIRLWTGRVRHYESMKFPAYRKALSNLVQGGVAEMVRVMITRMTRRTLDSTDVMFGTQLLLQVHDAIMFYVPDNKLMRVLPEIRKEMTNFNFRVPFKVDISYGRRWMQLEPWQQKP